jgi:deoxyribodipyrimidine photo-lyase
MNKPYERGLVWFRRDLRAHDHAALHHALSSCRQVFCLFVFDREILDGLPRADRRVEFIWHCLVELDAALAALALPHGVPGAGLIVLHDAARSAVLQQALALGVQAVFTNHDDEPQAIARDAEVAAGLSAQGVGFHSFKELESAHLGMMNLPIEYGGSGPQFWHQTLQCVRKGREEKP